MLKYTCTYEKDARYSDVLYRVETWKLFGFIPMFIKKTQIR
jgi:hypothetical protein